MNEWNKWRAPLHGVDPVIEEESWWDKLTGEKPKSRIRSFWDTLVGKEPPAKKVFNIGIDVGTSGIRVASFDENDLELTVFDFGVNKAGGTRFSFPSIVGIQDSKLVLGNEAAELPSQDRFESLKRSVMFQEDSKKFGEIWAKKGFPSAELLSNNSGPRAGEFLFTVLVARTLELSLPKLLGPSFWDVEARFVMGYPIQNDEEKDRFERVLATALVMMGTSGSQLEVEKLVQQFAGAWIRSEKMLEESEGERLFGLRTEAHATVCALEDNLRDNMTFVVADLGATTIEISVVRNPSPEPLVPYASESLPMGVDYLDELFVQEGIEVDLVDSRRSRQLQHDDNWNLQTTQPFMSFVKDLKKEIKRIISDGWMRNPNRWDWRRIDVAVVGGGSNILPLKEFILEELPDCHVDIRESDLMEVQMKEALVVGESEHAVNQQEQAELVCVFGLAEPAPLDFVVKELVNEPINYVGLDENRLVDW